MSIEIKQLFIFRIVFPYITRKKKLNLIKNNKNIQNFYYIDIEDYKSQSGIYKIGEKDGKGKEYDFDNKLLFEGEYKNGKKMEKEKNILMIQMRSKIILLNLHLKGNI